MERDEQIKYIKDKLIFIRLVKIKCIFLKKD
ncbi:hypothetical protein SPV_2508 [Streptococcus pneumoniae]|nr:hypothetical protein SPV_2508 [Streptococcus pneumoniae]